MCNSFQVYMFAMFFKHVSGMAVRDKPGKVIGLFTWYHTSCIATILHTVVAAAEVSANSYQLDVNGSSPAASRVAYG